MVLTRSQASRVELNYQMQSQDHKARLAKDQALFRTHISPLSAASQTGSENSVEINHSAEPQIMNIDNAPSHTILARSPSHYGLMQERIPGPVGSQKHVYGILIQAILWNQTRGKQALPVLVELLNRYPSALSLSRAKKEELADILYPIGLYNQRASRLLAFAQAWVKAPPCKHRRYRKLHYPVRGAGLDIGPDEVLDLEDQRQGWEVAHLPGVGPYALDSFRIFARDGLRTNAEGKEFHVDEEWRKVSISETTDKDLKQYLQWRWLKEPKGQRSNRKSPTK